MSFDGHITFYDQSYFFLTSTTLTTKTHLAFACILLSGWTAKPHPQHCGWGAQSNLPLYQKGVFTQKKKVLCPRAFLFRKALEQDLRWHRLWVKIILPDRGPSGGWTTQMDPTTAGRRLQVRFLNWCSHWVTDCQLANPFHPSKAHWNI